LEYRGGAGGIEGVKDWHTRIQGVMNVLSIGWMKA
jgi:hypothetical protein